MEMYGYQFVREDDLTHYGLKGMHWGVRRWQDSDGKFNEAGMQRYFRRGTGENYHPVKKGSGSSNVGGTSGNHSFNKERAKKIAKGVAIAGGVALAAYGAYKLSQIDPELAVKYKDVAVKALDTAKSAGSAASQTASKIGKAITSDEAKAAYKKIGDVTAKGAQGLANAAKKTYAIATSEEAKATYKKIGKTAADAATKTYQSLTSEQAKAKYKKAIETGKSAAEKAYKTMTSDKAVATYKKVGNAAVKGAKATGSAAKKAYKAATSEQAVTAYKNAAKATGSAAKKAYKAATSEQAKAAAKKAGKTLVKGAKDAGEIVKSAAELGKLAAQHPNEIKAATAYVKKFINSSPGNQKAAVREYKERHPNTEMSDDEIARRMGYGI